MKKEMIKRSLFTFLLHLIFNQLTAQTAGNLTAPPIDNLLLKQIESYSNSDKKESNNGIEGSPYLVEGFLPGKILTSGGEMPAEKLRYNVYQDNVEFESNGQRIILDPNSFLQGIVMGEVALTVCNYPFKMSVKRGFLIELVSGESSLYLKRNMSIREAQPPKALQSVGTPAQYVELSGSYFLKHEGNELTKVSSISDIIDSLTKYSVKLKSFVKNDRLSKKKEKDMIALVNYANSL